MAKRVKDFPLTVVGIGASAGGLEPLQQIISHLPTSLPDIAVIVAQHLSPDYKSMMVELLGRKTNIPVKHVDSGMQLTGNTIYIAPPNADVTINGRVLQLQEPIDGGAHPSVDVLFTSLAQNFDNHACGIILSGTGKDGSRGVQAIKNAGGVVIVQDPATAKYDGMPTAAVETAGVHHIVSPETIGSEFIQLVSRGRDKKVANTIPPTHTETTFTQIFDLLERRIGIDFSDYKISTLTRRLAKRMTEMKYPDEKSYLSYVKKHPEELDHLFEELLIGVTSFFRDPLAFKHISKIIEEQLSTKKSGEAYRIWIPGCATGEEAYTYAILIREIMEPSKKLMPLQIFATDIDMKALHRARVGVYHSSALASVPKPLIAKYFVKVSESTYEVHKEIRKMVLFSRHDVTSNPPFLRLDLVSCRNLLIYFNLDLQKRVVPLFYYALNPNGYLVLGKSENVGQFEQLFTTVNGSMKLFQRKMNDEKHIRIPQFRSKKYIVVPEETPTVKKEVLTIAEMVKETIYTSYENPYVVIDADANIIEIHGDTSMFLRFKEGVASLNFLKLVIPPLQIESRAVIGKAMKNNRSEKGNVRKIAHGDASVFVRLIAKPLLYTRAGSLYYLVIFEHVSLDETIFPVRSEPGDEGSAQLIELEQELDATKEHMNSLIEELETSNEELQALNEEMQASNEELQASNEELETSNEELQATNEELENAYMELREANKQIAEQKEEIEVAAENLESLLNNTLIGFILIDRDYRVVTYNLTAQKMYQKLYNTKLATGISFVKALPGDVFPKFHQNFKQALDGKQVVAEENVTLKAGEVVYFDFNYTPVKVEKDQKESRMIALSFIDITRRKNAEIDLISSNEALAQEKKFIETLTESLPSITWTTDAKGKYLYCNNTFFIYTGTKRESLATLRWEDFIYSSDWKNTAVLWKKSLRTGETFSVEHRIKNHAGEYRWHLTLVTAIKNAVGKSQLWLGTSTDIHEQKLLDERKNEFISIASHELKTPVTALKGYVQVVHNLLKKNELTKLGTTVEKVDIQLDRLTDLINDLLDVSRIESGKLLMQKRTFAIDALVADVVDSLQLTTDKHTIVRKGAVKQSIYSDPDRLEQVIINLLSNAIKYSPHGDTIILKTKMNHKNIVVSVQDFGIGIPKEKQEKIFSRFFRVDGEYTKTFPGMGLGLYISSEIIKRLGGSIWFESTEGEGSTFYFTIPLTNKESP